MKVTAIRKGVLFAIAAAAFGLGCELIVDFDRTKIPVETTDSATPTPEAGPDAPIDAPPVDAAEASAPCNAIALLGSAVVVQTATGAPPDPTGGTIVPGTYVLTEVTEYNATDAGATTATLRITANGTNNTFTSVTEMGTVDGGATSTVPENFTYTTTGTGDAGTFVATRNCPSALMVSYPYSVTDGGKVELRQTDGKTIRVFTKQ